MKRRRVNLRRLGVNKQELQRQRKMMDYLTRVGEINLDPSDIKISCVNIPDNQLPEEVVKYIRMYNPSYIDTSEPLEEHMFASDDLEEMMEASHAPRKHLEQIEELMDRNECAYFRLIKTKFP